MFGRDVLGCLSGAMYLLRCLVSSYYLIYILHPVR
jgi:hypothetical protein